MPHRFDPTILGNTTSAASSVRRCFPPTRCALGRVFAEILAEAGGRRAAVGYDGRLTSPEFEAALVEGLAEGGADVVRIGRGPTPMLYFAAATLTVDGGIMVTGSHNPPDHNGFKIVLGGKPFFGEAIQRVGRMALALGPARAMRGRVEEHSVFDDYVPRLAKRLRRYPPAECRLGLRQRSDGRRRRRSRAASAGAPHPDQRDDRRHLPGAPSRPDRRPRTSCSCSRRCRPKRCDLGIAFDGDGDRIGVVDCKGPDPVGRPAFDRAGARRPQSAILARRSSPTSRRARFCSTRSRAPAASR